ncbi:alpha-amylase, partial [Salipiger sp. HF18]|nr:alpha-amylase [Salipiger sp. HF18]
LHIDNGVRIIRLDAVAFLWKQLGTNCIHLPQTHAVIQLMRLLMDYATETVILLTETNVPKAENLSYFGHRNEAHVVYNFPLPPLILHAMMSGSARYLIEWQRTMPPAPLGCAYLNFTASHDGIGMRPAEGLLPPPERVKVLDTRRERGGVVSMRSLPGSQTIPMSLEGIPALYIHSMLATPNDLEAVERRGMNRAINRHRWDYPTLLSTLGDEETIHARVLEALSDRLRLRAEQPGFHPNATQFTLNLDQRIFGLWRQSLDRAQSIFALHNVSGETVEIPAGELNLIADETWVDLLSGEEIASGAVEMAPYQCRWITNLS